MRNLQLAPGSLLANRFEIRCAAESGGMGTVYRATDRHSGDTVALKLLHAGMGGPEEAERFLREAQLLSELHHPGIVAHVAHGQTADGQRFLAMEWLEGQDLGKRLARGPLLVHDCLRLLAQVADALSVSHQRGIIHRDLKPSNLFLCGGDIARVKILDFGIARRMATSQAMTRTGMVIGTPEYMAPEQARGNRDLTPATDLFSLGCVLYECLTGQPPFSADHVAAVLVRILFEEPVAVEDRRPGIPAALSAILGRLLAKDPAQRISDAAALGAELSRLGEVPEPALAVTVASPKPEAEIFAEQEQSLFSVVLASPQEENIGLGATLPGGGGQLAATDRPALLQAVAALGGSADFLANGTLVVTVPPLGSAQDQATVAARAALLIKERWPEAVVAMATGRGTVRGRTAVGEVVELAARSLKSRNEPSIGTSTAGVMIDPLSAKLLEGRFVLSPQPDGVRLFSEEKEVDESRPLLGKPTPCVGREAELSMLEAQLGSCIDESEARAIIITAPPGVGKSRLRHEFLRRVEKRSEPLTVLFGRGDLLRAGAAYGMVAGAIRRLCGLFSGEALDVQQRKLKSRVGEHLKASAGPEVLPFVGELCGVPFPEGEYPLLHAARQNGKSMADRLRRACLSFLAAECLTGPVLLILDDLHWGDELTVAFLDEALREFKNAPLCVLALGRPEIHTLFPSLWQRHKPQMVELKGLSRRAGGRLIQQVLGKQISAETAEWMLEQSAGNALFLEELIRAAAQGSLDKRPETVIAMLQARIGHMEAGPRRAVLAASVFGQTLWQGGVARLLGLRECGPEIEGLLQSLLEAELIERHKSSQIPGDIQYGFRHALVCEAAYGLLTENDQKRGHKLAAEFLQSVSPTPGSAVLAYHFRQAGLYEDALKHYLEAGDRSSKLSLFEEARIHYAASNELIRRLPDTPALRRLRVDLLLKRVHAGMLTLPAPDSLGFLEEARMLLTSLRAPEVAERADRLRMARVDFFCARIYAYSSRPEPAVHICQRVLPVAREFGEQHLEALASMVMAYAEIGLGRMNRAKEALLPLLGSAEEILGGGMEAARYLAYMAMALSASGQRQEFEALSARAYGQLPQPLPDNLLSGLHSLSAASHLCALDWSEAMHMSQQTIDAANRSGQALPLFLYTARDVLAWAQSYCGLPEQALSTRTQTALFRKSFGRALLEDWFEAGEAEILLNANRPEEALVKARLVVMASKESGLHFSHAVAERVWASALGRLGGELAEVAAHMNASLDVCHRNEQASNTILAELWWGRILRERREATAQLHFDKAFKMLADGGYARSLPWARDFALGQS